MTSHYVCQLGSEFTVYSASNPCSITFFRCVFSLFYKLVSFVFLWFVFSKKKSIP